MKDKTKESLLKSYLIAARDGAAIGVAFGLIAIPFAVVGQVAANALTRNQ